MIIPEITVSVGIIPIPFVSANAAISPDKAPVGPTILKLLPPNIEATSPAYTAVTIPITGEACEATASDTERGIDTKETVTPAFQFCPIREMKLCVV